MKDDYEYERAKLFLERKITVHVSTNNFFSNGLLLEVAKDFFVIKDRVDGKEKFIYFKELKNPIEPFKEEGE
jgi:hypothetical protein